MVITTADVFAFLYILVGIMLIVVLYHILLLALDVRRVMKRVERLTDRLEQVVLKPLAIAEQVIDNIMALFEGGPKKGKGFDHKKVR